jgi:hypothetical protein
MRTWAKWCINNNMRWVLYGMTILVNMPVMLGYNIYLAFCETRKDITSDFRAIKREPKI